MSAPSPAVCRKWQDRGGWAEDRALRRCSFPLAPRNTWSNLAYLLAGWVAYLILPEPSTLVHAVGMSFLGIASGWYHGSKRWVANLFDRAGMYAVFLPLAVHGWAPDAPITLPLMIGAGLLGALLFPKLIPGIPLDALMGGSVVAALVPSLLWGEGLVALLGLLLMALGKVAWVLDRRGGILVGLWGHAVWHILTAFGTSLLFLAHP